MGSSGVTKLSKSYPSKRAFITGAGSGLGLAFARQLAEQQWTIGITDVNSETLAETAREIEQLGGRCKSYIFDVTDYESFGTAIANFVEFAGGIDIGINNAGIGCGGALADVPVETFRKVIDINLMGTVNGCHLFIPIMKKQAKGHILNIASAAAFVAAPLMSAYNASKAAVMALSETLYTELQDDGIAVSVMAPTYIRTNIGRDSLGTDYVKARARILVEESTVSPDKAVAETYARMAEGALYIVLPERARYFWILKRFMPNRFRVMLKDAVKKEFERLNQQL